MKEKIKKILKQIHLYNFAKRIVGKKRNWDNNKRVESVLAEETKYASDKYKSIDSLISVLKIKIHGIEKAFVKGSTNYKSLENQCFNILSDLEKVLSTGYSKETDIVREGIGIIHLFLHEVNDRYDCSKVINALNKFIEKYQINESLSHNIQILNVLKDIPFDGNFNTYKDFVCGRHSVRHFKQEQVKFEDVKDIVRIAQICPSACNRQSTKVYYLKNSEMMRSLFPDPIVTKDIYNLLIVTVNKSYYSTSEVLQAWIDGGIFLESLVFAIHAKGLGACLFQCLKNTKKYYDVKNRIGIPENEDIVAFIGYGYLKDTYPVISSHRKEIEEVLMEVDMIKK